MTRLLGGLIAVLVLAAPAVAQHEHPASATAPEKLGTVSFETSCAPTVRGEFNRAVALLHSFEFRPAMESFTRVLERDGSCAIAYWGIALCHWGNPFGGVKAGPLLERGRCAVQGLRNHAAPRSHGGIREGDGARAA